MVPYANGQLAITASAQKIAPAGPPESPQYSFKAPSTNVGIVYIGATGVTTTTGYPIEPGEEFNYDTLVQAGAPVFDAALGDWYAVGTSGDRLAWLAHVAQ